MFFLILKHKPAFKYILNPNLKIYQFCHKKSLKICKINILDDLSDSRILVLISISNMLYTINTGQYYHWILFRIN